MNDPINHPSHYTSHPSGVEAITITEAFNFCVGNAVKYLWRAGLKGDALEDLQKARWYIDREIGRLTDSRPAEPPSRAAEQGFRVGARVRVLPTSNFMPGMEGEVISGIHDGYFDWLVKLDGCMVPSDMRETELEVIQ